MPTTYFFVTHPDSGHAVTVTLRTDAPGFLAVCSCGGAWTYDAMRDFEYMKSIFESHVKYANRTAIRPD